MFSSTEEEICCFLDKCWKSKLNSKNNLIIYLKNYSTLLHWVKES